MLLPPIKHKKIPDQASFYWWFRDPNVLNDGTTYGKHAVRKHKLYAEIYPARPWQKYIFVKGYVIKKPN